MENTLENKKYPAIDGLRAFSAVAIVLFHVIDRMLFRYKVEWGYKLEIFLSSFVSLFMMISAFSLCCGYYTKIKENKISLNEFYKKRYIRILPLFLLIVILDIVFSGFTKNNLFEGFANVTLLFGFLPHSNISIVGVGWTIGVIFAFYLLFPFFVFASWNKLRAWIFLVMSLLLRYISTNYFFEKDIEVIHSFIVWIPYFAIGIILFLYKDSLAKYLYKTRYLLWVLCIFLLVLKYSNPLVFGKDISDLYRILSDVSLVLVAIVSQNKVLSNRVTRFISRISYEIYMLHMLFINLFFIIEIDKKMNDLYMCVIIIFVLTMTLTTISGVIFKNINEKIGKILYN